MNATIRASRPKSAPPAPSAFSPNTLALQDAIKRGLRSLRHFAFAGLDIELAVGADSLWTLVRRRGSGGLAIRCGYAPGGPRDPEVVAIDDGFRVTFDSVMGRFVSEIVTGGIERPLLRIKTTLTPGEDTLVGNLPRDLYPLDANDDPCGATGNVEAAQRGLNVGAIYFRYDRPAFGEVLYVQNLTALNPYFNATGTKPDGAIGGEWPELGYLPPAPPQSGVPPHCPLPKGKAVVLSDAIVVFGDDASDQEQISALKFLQMLAATYPHIGRPVPELRDWIGRTERTLRDLDKSPDATVRCYGARYVRPYTAAEYPDSMVQLSVLAAICDWQDWSGKAVPLARALRRGVRRFYDPKLGTLRRYLPNVGEDKNADAVDSWYLYHPLLNLGRLAKIDDDARALFFDCTDYAIKAARHFKYAWPIQFDIKDFTVITEARNGDGLGQTDVGGLYAYVMMQAFEMTAERRYLDEAKAAMDAARGMRFELNYQANLTAWGATACIRLYRVTNQRRWLDNAYVYLASLLHNTLIWESEIGGAAHYENFLGATCLHDAPYMALYECYDSVCAFEQFLKEAGPDLDDGVRFLVSEYCRYALSRAWFYYPDALPAELLAKDNRNGHINRALSFPVEDLYGDGQPAGQVGQEIYGCGAAPSFAVRAFHRLPSAPFLIYCDQFAADCRPLGLHAAVLSLSGSSAGRARLIFLKQGRRRLPKLVVAIAGQVLEPSAKRAGQIEFTVPADARVAVRWEDPARSTS